MVVLDGKSRPWRRFRGTSAGERIAHSSDDISRSVLAYDFDYAPTEPLEHLRSPNIYYVLSPVATVMVPVILHANLRPFPTHIEVGDELAIGHSDLGSRSR
jgi:hypothetical protein